jgi:MFS family permease
MKKLDNFFGIKKSGSSFRTEIVAGIVTFLAMAYILTLNPLLMLNMFNADTYGYLYSSVFIATAIGAFIGTLLMAIYAKLPLAQAPGLGLNSMVGGLLGGGLIGTALSFGNSMLLVLISGVLFLLLSIFKISGVSIREIIYKAIPESVRKAISIGIGLFIAIIGLANAGIVGAGNGPVIGMVAWSSWDMAVVGPALVCLFGFFAGTKKVHCESEKICHQGDIGSQEYTDSPGSGTLFVLSGNRETQQNTDGAETEFKPGKHLPVPGLDVTVSAVKKAFHRQNLLFLLLYHRDYNLQTLKSKQKYLCYTIYTQHHPLPHFTIR